jgi:hypothetical protein
MKKSLLLLGVTLFTVTLACKKQSVTYNCSGSNPTYTNDIKAIYDASCATGGCHSSASHAASINLSSYSGSSACNDDKLLGSIEHKSGYNAMPQGSGILPEEQRQLIYCWIQNGKPQ